MPAVTAAALLLVHPVASAPSTATPSTDLGPKAGTDIKTVSLVLKLRNQDQLVKYVGGTSNPKSSYYHQFLSVPQFTATYGPASADVAAVVSDLKANGITVSGVSPNNLAVKASGTVSAFNNYFSTTLHEYASGAQRYHAPATPPVIPSRVSNSVAIVVGLSSQPIYHSKAAHQLAAEGTNIVSAPAVNSDGGSATGIPGQFTVGDVVKLYQVRPLYSAGIKGKGRTVGIATLATFDPTDAYGYWAGIGLNVKANRITQVHVDGGGDTAGADETTLDVEQSGGLAPYADVVVYDAPNTDQGFFDVFLQAVIDNKVDTLSVSWGLAEIEQNPALVAGQDEVFLEAAVQGMSLFASSGDSGAFDVNRNYPFPQCNKLLSTDSPASSPFVTAAGGLTIAGLQTDHRYPTPVVNVPQDRPWGWNYLADYFNTHYSALGGYYGLAFPLGGGGGVSVNEPLPWYQRNVRGIKTSQPSQSLFCTIQASDGSVQFVDLIDMPENQPGRNVPDLSLNADPYTGYLLYFGGQWYSGNGGTSFVAPQLNGITALLSQAAGSRLGLLNPALYRLAAIDGYGSNDPFNDITAADNLGFQASPGYDPASGIGSINAANLSRALSEDPGEADLN